ncbi:dihydroxy-acid dehydratase [Ornithinimicrobium sp. Y1847]|uniref:dihydroxy-acid dehydratase n=1 Tax=Ornithinimicrobium sp. Y1847 TaxID=3405419 RepID=UPI003B678CCA
MGLKDKLTAYGDEGFSAFLRTAFLSGGGGLGPEDTDRPWVGIADTSSDLNPCHANGPRIIDAVKRGVLQAGGMPLVFPMLTLHESFANPTSMLYRNLLAMSLEETLRMLPLDAVVALGGCDKTIPAQIMALISAETPGLIEPVGPMQGGQWRGERLGACTDCRRMWADYRGGDLTDSDITEVSQQLVSTGGTCMVMGTATTMALVSEHLGATLEDGATAPTVSGERLRHAAETGRAAVALARGDRQPFTAELSRDKIVSALELVGAVGGSTNAVVHLLGIGHRLGITFSPQEVDGALGRHPLVVDLKPSGQGYADDLHRAGGLAAIMAALAGDPAVAERGGHVRPIADPVKDAPTMVVLTGSLTPEGSILKTAAASPQFFEHEGSAIVFDDLEEASLRLEDPEWDVDPDDILIMRGIGPLGMGMPEAGSLPIPKSLSRRGIRDIVRVSDGRMSGTSYGTVVLHASPEGVRPGPLAVVRTGDRIRLSVSQRRLDLLIDASELQARLAAWEPVVPEASGYQAVHNRHVMSAWKGADLDLWSSNHSA